MDETGPRTNLDDVLMLLRPLPVSSSPLARETWRRLGIATLLLGLLAVLLLVLASPSVAQDADSLRQRPDSLRQGEAPHDSLQAARTEAPRPSRTTLGPLLFADPTYGRALADSLPTRLPVEDLEHLLAGAPGTFFYDLAAVAWPHGWSVGGTSPQRTQLWLHDAPFDDPVTGRPRFDLMPVSFLSIPQVGVDVGGRPTAVYAAYRPVPEKRPYTEIRFRRDSNGLQNVAVLHSQKRRFTFDGRDHIFQITGGYAGRATQGIYAGSDLRRERRIWGRVRWQTPLISVELRDVSSRHRLGAQGGVVPPSGFAFEGIFLPLLAEESVRNRDASRETIRNDLTLRVRGRLNPRLRAATTSLTWTSNTYTFRPDYSRAFPSRPDTTWAVKSNSVHGALRQPLRVGPHRLMLNARGTYQEYTRGTVLQNAPTQTRGSVSVRDSLTAAGWDFVGDVGLHTSRVQQFASASLEGGRRLPLAHVTAQVGLDGQRLDWVHTDGFAGLVDVPGDLSPGPVVTASVTADVLGGGFGPDGPLDLSVKGFASTIRDAVDFYSAPELGVDTLAVQETASPVRRAGATVTFGWRRGARRGVYATAQATALTVLNPDASALHERLAETVPPIYGRGRIGARFILFTDFTTDLYVQGRGWTQTNSRRFHSPTGLFVVPPLSEPIQGQPGLRVGPSGTLDVHAEAVFKGAKLFFSYENAQANSELQPGTFLVPTYPFPPRQFRFGVSWPILN